MASRRVHSLNADKTGRQQAYQTDQGIEGDFVTGNEAGGQVDFLGKTCSNLSKRVLLAVMISCACFQ